MAISRKNVKLAMHLAPVVWITAKKAIRQSA
jgi:hypothetical protein